MNLSNKKMIYFYYKIMDPYIQISQKLKIICYVFPDIISVMPKKY
jgi:hypothetical protein